MPANWLADSNSKWGGLRRAQNDAPVAGNHPDGPKDLEEAECLNDRLVMHTLAMDGTCTGEHGDVDQRRCRTSTLYPGLQGSNVKTVTPRGSDANDGQQVHAQRSVKCSPVHHDASLSGHVRRLIE